MNPTRTPGRRVPLALAGCLLLLTLGGCILRPVQPWERDLLAEPEMQLVPDATESALNEHIYFSKEAPHGGEGVGGGGCGCN